jgi:hypothetical protein
MPVDDREGRCLYLPVAACRFFTNADTAGRQAQAAVADLLYLPVQQIIRTLKSIHTKERRFCVSH